MISHYAVLRPVYVSAGIVQALDGPPIQQFNVRWEVRGVVPARTTQAAFIIAKALGHRIPVIRRLEEGELQ